MWADFLSHFIEQEDEERKGAQGDDPKERTFEGGVGGNFDNQD